jgi:DNA-binding transcriptional MerR regulator
MRDPPALPETKYFKIGEVAALEGVEPHVLRYWETQFPQVRPHKARSGHRLYRRHEVETLLVIRELLHVQRFTIAGARQALRQPGGAQSLLPRFFLAGEAGDAADVSSRAGTHVAADITAQELVEVEAEGLNEDELNDALERQGAGSGDVVAFDVTAEPRQKQAAAVPMLPGRRGDLSTSLSVSRTALLEEALLSARALLAVLDREDFRDRPQA